MLRKEMFTVRNALPTDAEAACIAIRRSITECCVDDHVGNPKTLDAWLANKTPDTVRSWFQSRSYSVVAEKDGAIVGTAMLLENGTIVLFYLVPEAHNLGIGKAMLRSLEAEARRRGLRRIELDSTKAAHEFYRRNSFADTGKMTSAFGLAAPQMQKDLGDARGPTSR